MGKDLGIKYTNKYEIDEKDKKIIKTLFENGRYSIAQISNKTGLGRDSVMHRLNKMQEKQLITGFQPIINPPTLGYPNVAQILLKTKLSAKENKIEFTKKLVKMPPIVHMANTIGKYDMFIALLYKDSQQLYSIIEDIKTAIPDYILEYEVLQVVDEPKFEDVEGLVLNL